MSRLSATIEHTFGDQSLMDLQEWLKEDFSVYRAPGQAEVRFSARDLIAEIANTLGTSHYDEDMSETVVSMSLFNLYNLDLLARSLCEMSRMTANLGIWVLRQFGEKGLIDLAALTGPTPP